MSAGSFTRNLHVLEKGPKARFYVSSIGRFSQPDPIIPEVYEPKSLGRYTYVYNNPIRYTDPSGNCIFGIDTLVCLGALVFAVIPTYVDYVDQRSQGNYEGSGNPFGEYGTRGVWDYFKERGIRVYGVNATVNFFTGAIVGPAAGTTGWVDDATANLPRIARLFANVGIKSTVTATGSAVASISTDLILEEPINWNSAGSNFASAFLVSAVAFGLDEWHSARLTAQQARLARWYEDELGLNGGNGIQINPEPYIGPLPQLESQLATSATNTIINAVAQSSGPLLLLKDLLTPHME